MAAEEGLCPEVVRAGCLALGLDRELEVGFESGARGEWGDGEDACEQKRKAGAHGGTLIFLKRVISQEQTKTKYGGSSTTVAKAPPSLGMTALIV